MYPLARLANELHVAQYRLIIAVLKVGPYPALPGLAGSVEFGGGKRGEGAARDVGMKPARRRVSRSQVLSNR